jgi:Nucleotidyltransferase domain
VSGNDTRRAWPPASRRAKRSYTDRVSEFVTAPPGVLDRLCRELTHQGAIAIAVTGSRARGNPSSRSDLDVIAIGDGPSYYVDVWEDILVAQAWSAEEEQAQRLSNPRDIGSSVPGWREAVILHDPQGVAAQLQRQALGFEWSSVEERCDEWVAEELVGYAEEVQKLVVAIGSGQLLSSSVMRTLLAFRMPRIAAVYHRLLYGSENALWDQVADVMGPEWRQTHAAAFSLNAETYEESCTAALHLYRLTFDTVSRLLDDRQTRVARYALSQVPHSI